MSDVHRRASQHILLDHFDLIYDVDKSYGNYIVDKVTGKKYLDCFSFIASNPIGHNHPKLKDNDFERKLLKIAKTNPSNSDILTEEYVDFLETFNRIAVPREFKYKFFISGGALAVENALKASFDWKYKLLQHKQYSNIRENDLVILHFKHAFHGRSGYTLSLTNTADPRKYDLFPKFDWPRINIPDTIEFEARGQECILKFNQDINKEIAKYTITNEFWRDNNRIAAVIVEPIQGEGGDRHFPKEIHHILRKVCDDNDIILIYDEVQTGLGLSGKTWAYQNYGIVPDIISFGKKMQVCGILATERFDLVENHVFKEKSRLNSTWGGSLTDMVRAQRYLEIIEEDNLIENARDVGAFFLSYFNKVISQDKLLNDKIQNIRGIGLMISFDIAETNKRTEFINLCFDNKLFVLPCGEKSIRLRPSLTFSCVDSLRAISIIRKCLHKLYDKSNCSG